MNSANRLTWLSHRRLSDPRGSRTGGRSSRWTARCCHPSPVGVSSPSDAPSPENRGNIYLPNLPNSHLQMALNSCVNIRNKEGNWSRIWKPLCGRYIYELNLITCFLLTNHVSRVGGRAPPEEQLRLTQSPTEYSGDGGFSTRGTVFGVTEKEVKYFCWIRKQSIKTL